MTSLADVAAKLENARASGSSYKARCLFHERHNNGDTNPSMSLFNGRDGNPMLKCEAGCSTSAELMKEARTRKYLDDAKPAKSTDAPKQMKGKAEPKYSAPPPWERRVKVEHLYPDKQRSVQGKVIRFADGLEPKCLPQRPDGRGGWEWKGFEDRLIYRLPDVLEAKAAGKTLFIAEGESDVDALVNLGFVATCNPGGALKWRSHHTDYLRGSQAVVIFGDNDPSGSPGPQHAEAVARALYNAGVRVVKIFPPAPHKDVRDWIETGGATAEKIQTVVKAAEWYAPQAALGVQSVDANPLDPATALAEMNRRHAFVMLGGKAAIAIDPESPTGDLIFSARNELAQKYANRTVLVPGKNGPAPASLFDFWWRSPERRQYERVDFLPGKESCPDVFNLWRGFAVKPEPGDCSLYLKLVRDSLVNGSPVIADYVLNWMAQAVQRPWEKPQTAIALTGGQGTGKGSIAVHFGKLFGPHFIHAESPEVLTGRFSLHLADKLVVFADEAFFSGDHRAVGILKARITEPVLSFEGKGRDPVMLPNYSRIIAASNERWMVPAGMDERRWAVFSVADCFKGKRDFWRAFYAQMQAGGQAALLHHLLQRNIADFNALDFPRTAALAENIIATMEPITSWWFERLYEGAPTAKHEGWPDWVSCADLLYDLDAFAKRHPRKVPINGTAMGRLLRDVGKLSGSQAHFFGDGPLKGKTCRAYYLPELSTARGDFEQATGFKLDWPNENEALQVQQVAGKPVSEETRSYGPS